MGQAAKRSTTLGASRCYYFQCGIALDNESRGVPQTKGNKIERKICRYENKKKKKKRELPAIRQMSRKKGFRDATCFFIN